MSKMNDGGAAFPRPYAEDTTGDWTMGLPQQDGMTLRDWFAGQALAFAILGHEDGVARHDKMAEYCYRHADAMLKERDK
jgi:hypothetical protein